MSSSYNEQKSKAKSKSRAKVVKPILRKLAPSEKNSLDLDRLATEQDGLGIYDYGGVRSANDVSFAHSSRRGYHNRSTSGASQFSTATSASGNRSGSFVHPFQQTPRPFTPPIGGSASYQNSLRESEHSNSPALTEDEDQLRHNFRSTSNLSNNQNHNLNHRSPSLTGTASSPVISQAQPLLRIQTKQASTSRLALATSHTSLQSTPLLSPEFTTPTESMSPSSAMRTSMDRGFRIRSRSDINHTPTETVQEARRKWNARQKEKEERAALEDVKQIERQNKKEARQISEGQRQSSTSESNRTKRSRSDLTVPLQEKDVFVGRDYNSAPLQTPPFTSESLEPPKRSHTTISNTKKKTHSAWTKLMMWLRTRFIRMGKKKGRSR